MPSDAKESSNGFTSSLRFLHQLPAESILTPDSYRLFAEYLDLEIAATYKCLGPPPRFNRAPIKLQSSSHNSDDERPKPWLQGLVQRLARALLDGVRAARPAVDAAANEDAWMTWHEQISRETRGRDGERWAQLEATLAGKDQPFVSVVMTHYNRPALCKQVGMHFLESRSSAVPFPNGICEEQSVRGFASDSTSTLKYAGLSRNRLSITYTLELVDGDRDQLFRSMSCGAISSETAANV
jgi:hypothetical protein